MPKGRIFAPATDKDGVWYRHRGIPEQTTFIRTEDTSTGKTLERPFLNIGYPPSPPMPYHLKNVENFRDSNKFSDHDNRNSFQDHGVYFGNGNDRSLGRKVVSSVDRQHFTPNDYLHHDSIIPRTYEYNSIYCKDYKGRPTSEPPVRRRFPQIYKEPVEGIIDLPTSTPLWQPNSGEKRVPIKVLAVSQQPYLKPNSWKYSYNSLAKCYPTLTK